MLWELSINRTMSRSRGANELRLKHGTANEGQEKEEGCRPANRHHQSHGPANLAALSYIKGDHDGAEEDGQDNDQPNRQRAAKLQFQRLRRGAGRNVNSQKFVDEIHCLLPFTAFHDWPHRCIVAPFHHTPPGQQSMQCNATTQLQ